MGSPETFCSSKGASAVRGFRSMASIATHCTKEETIRGLSRTSYDPSVSSLSVSPLMSVAGVISPSSERPWAAQPFFGYAYSTQTAGLCCSASRQGPGTTGCAGLGLEPRQQCQPTCNLSVLHLLSCGGCRDRRTTIPLKFGEGRGCGLNHICSGMGSAR